VKRRREIESTEMMVGLRLGESAERSAKKSGKSSPEGYIRL
jgi:hypothetical protein